MNPEEFRAYLEKSLSTAREGESKAVERTQSEWTQGAWWGRANAFRDALSVYDRLVLGHKEEEEQDRSWAL